ncbi:hypothetical protein OF364_02630, partial [Mycoplasma enhydrae]|uniref:hypothetical protein n=1 Tax=Mycoplasma enhydrae TaxID=2499220 RepID=UPI0021E7A608
LLESLKESLKTAEDKAKGEEERIKGIIEEIDRKLQETAQKLQTAKNAEGKYDTSVIALDALNTQITQNNDYQTDLKKDAKNKTPKITAKLEELKNKTTEAKTKHDDLVNKNTQLKSEVETKLSDAQSSWNAARTDLDAAIANKNETKLKEIKTALEASLELAKAAKQFATDKDYDTFRINSETLINDIERDLDKIKEALEGVERDRIAKVKEKLETVIKSLDDLIKKNDHANKYDSTRAYVTQLNNLINTIENDVYDIYNKPENTSVAELNQKLTELKNKLDEAKRHSEAQTKAADNIKKAHDTAYENWKNNEYKQAQDADNANPQTAVEILKVVQKYESAKEKLLELMNKAQTQEYIENNTAQTNDKTDIENRINALNALAIQKGEEQQLKDQAQYLIDNLNLFYDKLKDEENFQKIENMLNLIGPEIINRSNNFIENNKNKDFLKTIIAELKTITKKVEQLVKQKVEFIENAKKANKAKFEELKQKRLDAYDLLHAYKKETNITDEEYLNLYRDKIQKIIKTFDELSKEISDLYAKTLSQGDNISNQIGHEKAEWAYDITYANMHLLAPKPSIRGSFKAPRFITKSDFEFQIDPTKYQALVERMTIDDLSGSVYIRLKILLNANQGVLISKEYKLTTQPYVATIFKNFRPKNDVVDSLEDVKNDLLSGGSSQERINTLKKYFEWDNDLLPDEELFSIEVSDEDTIALNLYTRISRSAGIYNEGNSSYNSKHHYPMGLKDKINENRKRWIEQNYRKFASANLWEVLDKKNRLSQLSVDDVRLKNMPVQLPKGMEFKKFFISPNENEGSIKIVYKIIDHNNNANDKTYQTAELTGLQKYIPKVEVVFTDRFLKVGEVSNYIYTLGQLFQRLIHTTPYKDIKSDRFLQDHRYNIWYFGKLYSAPGEPKAENINVKYSDNKYGVIISYDVTYEAITGRYYDPYDDQIKLQIRNKIARVNDHYFDFHLLAKALAFASVSTHGLKPDQWTIEKLQTSFPGTEIDGNNDIYKDFVKKQKSFMQNSKSSYFARLVEQNKFKSGEIPSNIEIQKELVREWKQWTKILSPLLDEIIRTTSANEKHKIQRKVSDIRKWGYLTPHIQHEISFRKLLVFVTDNDNTLDENFFNV